MDKHRGIAAQKATEIRRATTDVESRARELRERQSGLESGLMSLAATSWPEAAAKARYVLNIYAASLSPDDTRHRDLVAAILADFARLDGQS
ncbi:hypothetical protein [Bradyrhizobium sp. BRP56]|uniref:hypothetical protein n=1 Tax=Bradyrhizobium sp. BRP56 TaxID=2793819 RepID=UPI001CD31486|nr:hypothetical protein [Bradyrhizobium sp. BRP56]